MSSPTRRLPAVLPLCLCLCATTCAQDQKAGSPGGLVERNSPLQVVEPDANERDLRTTPVVRAVQRAADSVVSIYLQHQLANRGEAVTEGQGSGVILDDSGLVITNWHVVAPVVLGDRRGGADLDVMVKLRDGRSRPASVLSSSAKRDLALLQLKLEADEKVKPIEIGRSADLMIGETVIAIGNPQGHANTVTSGVLSAIDRSIRVRAPDGAVRDYSGLLQTDAAINQGNSGGALLDITGRLIGINNAMAMGAENIGFAIPMDSVRQEFERELIQSASFATAADAPWLGLEVQEKDGAVTIAEVKAGSPADQAGIRVGDVLARIGDQDVRNSLDYVRRFFSVRADEPLSLLLRRGGRELKVQPVPISRTLGIVLDACGAKFTEVDVETDPQLVRRTTLKFYRNSNLRRVPLFPAVLRVESVLPDSPAEAIGLEPGDVLLGVLSRGPFGDRDVPVHSLRDWAQLLDQQRGRSLRISVLRGDRDLGGTLEVRAAANR
ncbi:MAG: trypsin-like peptidase domain-containing protein [Planctomycetes bacterium]|nr:trypsin-like peptidase domain-containing protein [Planctomycetota bacterium]